MTRPTAFLRASKAIAAAGSFVLATGFASPARAQDAPADGSPAMASAAAAAAAASSLGVTPLRIEMPTGSSAEIVQVQNTTGSPMAVQIRLFAWFQQAGEDIYTQSSDLLVSPSIVSIPAGQTQLVRVMRKGMATSDEKRFRLVIDQLPDPAKARPGVAQTRVRFAVPVFVDRDKAAPAAFAWRMTDGALELVNTGGVAARIVQIEVKKPDGRIIPVEQNSLRYVHGASTIAWPIGKGCSLGKVHVTAQIDGQTVDAEPVPACS